MVQYLAVLFTFLSVALALGGVAEISRHRSRLAQRLLAERDPHHQEATSAAREPGLLERLEREAQQAGLNWNRRLFLFCLAASMGLSLLFGLSQNLTAALAVPPLGILGPALLVRYRAQARATLFAQQLPGTLMLMANVIRAGGTLYQAIHAVVRQVPEPMRAEFLRVERTMQLQVPAGEALERIKDRIGLHEFTSVVVACKVAGEAGADLDRVLESVSRELVEDRQFLKAMEAASAEGKASARLVTAVPFVVMGLVTYNSPGYFGQALQDATGRVMLLGSLAAILMGWFLIQRITDVRNW